MCYTPPRGVLFPLYTPLHASTQRIHLLRFLQNNRQTKIRLLSKVGKRHKIILIEFTMTVFSFVGAVGVNQADTMGVPHYRSDEKTTGTGDVSNGFADQLTPLFVFKTIDP
jgi:hypothetical protein